MASVVLAGCVGGDGPGTDTQDGPRVITDPTDIANGTQPGAHIHDYWGGQDRLTVIEDATVMSCMICVEASWSFRPPEGTVVPQGTAYVNITADWSTGTAAVTPPLELWVKSQADNAIQYVQDLEDNVTVAIPTTLEDADLPHQVLSAWQVTIVVGSLDDPQPYTLSTPLDLTVTADRGLELPEFPPHPDHWGSLTSMELFDDETTRSNLQVVGSFSGMSFPRHQPDDGVIVAPGTGTVTVTLENDSPVPLALRYHAADTREWTPLESTADTGGGQTYEIPVTGTMADGPYALQSLWEFQVYADVPETARPYSGSYVLSAVAAKATE